MKMNLSKAFLLHWSFNAANTASSSMLFNRQHGEEAIVLGNKK